MIELELEADILTQIHQINAVGELKRVKLSKPPQSWGGQMSAEITWELCENLRFTARTGFTTALVNQVSYIGDALTLTFEYAPLHLVKLLLETQLDCCVFDSAHEKAEVLHRYGIRDGLSVEM